MTVAPEHWRSLSAPAAIVTTGPNEARRLCW